MKMQKMVLVSTILAIITSVVSTLAYAEGVKVKDIEAKTTVTGGVIQAAVGDGTSQDQSVGGISGNVEGDKIKIETTVTGGVIQAAVGDKNKQRQNVGGVIGGNSVFTGK